MPITTKVELASHSWRGVLDTAFVSDLRQDGGFYEYSGFLNKIALHDITEILLKAVLNTIDQPTNFQLTGYIVSERTNC